LTVSPTRRRAAIALRFAAVVPCLIALPIFWAAGWGLAAWGLSAGLLALNIALAAAFDLAGRGRGQVTIVGLMGVSLLLRAWLTFGILFAVAWWGDRQLAVAAAAAFLLYFTVDMVGRSVAHVVTKDDAPRPVAPAGEAA
jgi:hypothetical protein